MGHSEFDENCPEIAQKRMWILKKTCNSLLLLHSLLEIQISAFVGHSEFNENSPEIEQKRMNSEENMQ